MVIYIALRSVFLHTGHAQELIFESLETRSNNHLRFWFDHGKHSPALLQTPFPLESEYGGARAQVLGTAECGDRRLLLLRESSRPKILAPVAKCRLIPESTLGTGLGVQKVSFRWRQEGTSKQRAIDHWYLVAISSPV
jgi:hypothetical protein